MQAGIVLGGFVFEASIFSDCWDVAGFGVGADIEMTSWEKMIGGSSGRSPAGD